MREASGGRRGGVGNNKQFFCSHFLVSCHHDNHDHSFILFPLRLDFRLGISAGAASGDAGNGRKWPTVAWLLGRRCGPLPLPLPASRP